MKPLTAAALPEIADNFTSFTFRIRPGIYFADDPAFKGVRRELVAQDYVYALKRHYDPRFKSPNLYLLENAKILGLSELKREVEAAKQPFPYDREVEGLRALDRYTFRVRLAEPSPRFHQQLMTDSSVFGAVAREVVEFYGDKIAEHPVGTGAFRLAQWRRSSKIVLERNPGFRETFYDETAPADDPRSQAIAKAFKGRRMPMLDRVEISIIEEAQPRWLSFLNRQTDFMDRLPNEFASVAIPNNTLAPNLTKQGILMDRAPLADVAMAFFNNEHPLVGGNAPEKVALRRAIALAYSNEEEVRLVRKGQAIQAQGPIAPSTYGYDPQLKTEMGDHDPARARALLDLYGYVDRDGDGWRDQPNGQPLVLEYATQPDQLSRQSVELWEKQLKAVGIRIVFKVAKWPENLKASRTGKLMMWGVAWLAGSPDGDTFLALGYGPNKGGANHSRFDLAAYNALYIQQNKMPDGPGARAGDARGHAPARGLHALQVQRPPHGHRPDAPVGHRLPPQPLHPRVLEVRRHRPRAAPEGHAMSAMGEPDDKRRRQALQVGLALGAASAFPALAADPSSSGSAGAGAERVLRYALPVAETGFDPAQISDLYSRIITAHIFDGLYHYDPLARPFLIKPNVTEALPQVSADFTVWTMRIKPGIHFADDPAFKGAKRELVAQDYVYSLKRFFDPVNKSPVYSSYKEEGVIGIDALRDEAIKNKTPFDYDREIEGLRALDRYTLQFRLSKPNPRFLYTLAGGDLLGAVAREVVERYGDKIMEHPVGTGPFRLAQWRRSSRIVLERNPGFREVTSTTANPTPTTPKARRWRSASRAGACRWSTAWSSTSSRSSSRATWRSRTRSSISSRCRWSSCRSPHRAAPSHRTWPGAASSCSARSTPTARSTTSTWRTRSSVATRPTRWRCAGPSRCRSMGTRRSALPGAARRCRRSRWCRRAAGATTRRSRPRTASTARRVPRRCSTSSATSIVTVTAGARCPTVARSRSSSPPAPTRWRGSSTSCGNRTSTPSASASRSRRASGPSS